MTSAGLGILGCGGIRRDVLAFAVLVVSAGCGRSIETASISGRVTFDGQPVANGTIAFLPVDGKGPTAGAVIANGAYAVAKLTPGPKLVRIEAFAEQVAFPRSRGDMERQSRDRPRPVGPSPVADPNLIPADAPGNNAEVAIVRGSQQRDFEITGRAQLPSRP